MKFRVETRMILFTETLYYKAMYLILDINIKCVIEEEIKNSKAREWFRDIEVIYTT